jgi:hypothetical protein
MMPWDGTEEAWHHIAAWVGHGLAQPMLKLNGARPPYGTWQQQIAVWNTEENGWINCPVGHRIAKGRLGEFYPISPAALEAGFVPAADGQ